MITRRNFLSVCVAASLPSAQAAALKSARENIPVLTARVAKAQLAPAEYDKTAVWTFGNTVPGQSLRLKQGERFQRLFENQLPEPSAVHWHGIRIDNRMDGVPGLTQTLVQPGTQFLYDFTVPDAGTYWYHSHHRSWEQMARGLYGPLIVEEAVPPKVDRDEALLIDDWRMGSDAQILDDFGQMMQMSHGGRTGNWLTVNGRGVGESSINVSRYERLRLRLINTANASLFQLKPQGLSGALMALDGQPLESPEPFTSIVLAPGQRADVIVDITAPDGENAFLNIVSGRQSIPMVRFVTRGQRRATALPVPSPLQSNELPWSDDVVNAPLTELHMEGGAMGRLQQATYQGKMMGMRDLVGNGMVWAFNGVAGMTGDPLLTASRGDPVRINIINDTSWPHGMHLHGHHFREINDQGGAGPWRDTLLLDRGERRQIGFIADNPGDWLLHCHMLEHQASGMKTWFRVS